MHANSIKHVNGENARFQAVKGTVKIGSKINVVYDLQGFFLGGGFILSFILF